MPRQVIHLKVFIASPSGLKEERAAVRKEIEEYNRCDARPRGVVFDAVGSEDVLGDRGRPQSQINKELQTADYFVSLLWDHWGSPPDISSSDYSSGTEEEFHLALKCQEDGQRPMRKLVVAFRSLNHERQAGPDPELKKVLEFKKKLEAEQTILFHTFDSTATLQELIRRHVAAWLLDEEGGEVETAPSPALGPQLDSDLLRTSRSQPPELPEDLRNAEAWVYANGGHLVDAESEFARSIDEHGGAGPRIDYGRFLHRLGRMTQAKQLLEDAIVVATNQGDGAALAVAYGNLGNVLRTQGDMNDAEKAYRKALKVNKKLDQAGGMADDYANLGNVLYARRDLNGAEEMYQKALKINEKRKRAGGIADAYGNLGNVLHDRRDLDGAVEMYQKALEIDERLGRTWSMAHDYGNLGNLLYARRDLNGAEEMYQKALEIDERLGRAEGMAKDYVNLGNVLHDRGDLDGAVETYRKALAAAQRTGSSTLINEAESLIRSLRRPPVEPT